MACLSCVREGVSFTIECNTSEHTLAACLNQAGQPVALHSRTFSPSENQYSIAEKDATAIIDAVRKWNHYLHGHKFFLVAD